MKSISNNIHVIEAALSLGHEFTWVELADKAIEMFPEHFAKKCEGYESVDIAISQIRREYRCKFAPSSMQSINVPGKFNEDGTSMKFCEVFNLDKRGKITYISIKPNIELISTLDTVDVDTQPTVVDTVEDRSDRGAIERKGIERMGDIERSIYEYIYTLPKQLSLIVDSDKALFDVDHANTIHEHGIDAIDYRNLQLLSPRVNQSKNKESLPKMDWNVQVQKIKSVLDANYYRPLSKEQNKRIDMILAQFKLFY